MPMSFLFSGSPMNCSKQGNLSTAKNVLPDYSFRDTLPVDANACAPVAGLSRADLERMERQLIPLLNTVRQMQGKRPVVVPGEKRTGT